MGDMIDSPAGTTKGLSIDPLVDIKSKYVDQALHWYRSRTLWPRLVFRTVGTLVIVLSLGIPFLAALETTFGKWPLQLASFLIAALTALNSFFGWQKTWEKRISMQLTLEGLVALWQMEIAAAMVDADPRKGFERALKVTQELVEKTQALTVAETSAFFANIRFPVVPVEPGPTKNNAA
jgi:hypothetical protein